MMNRLEVKTRGVDAVLSQEYRVGDNKISYGAVRDFFEEFLGRSKYTTVCRRLNFFKNGKIVDTEDTVREWRRVVLLGNGTTTFRLEICTTYGEEAADLERADIYVRLSGLNGGSETATLHSRKWFLEQEALTLQAVKMEKVVGDLAEIVIKLREGNFVEVPRGSE